MWNFGPKAFAFLRWEVYFHMSGVLTKVVEYFRVWCAYDVVDFVYLVQFIVTWEKGDKTQDFVHDAADTPNVHFVAVIAVSHQAFWGSVPPCRDVFG